MQKNKPVRPFQEVAVDLCSYICRVNVLDYCGLLHRLVSCHLLGPRYLIYSGHYLYPPVILPLSHPRCAMVRWWEAESAVKSMKKLIQACWTGRSLDHEKFCRALLQYRNTPSRKDRLSPAQNLFGNPVRDILPAHHCAFLPGWQCPVATAEQQRHDNLESSAAFYNQHTHPLKDITVGSHVAIQNPQTN